MMTAITKFENLSRESSLIRDWINYCDVRETTAKTYFKAAVHFLNYIADKNGAVAPTRNDIIAYRENLKSTVAITTARLYFSIVRTFIKWLATKGIVGRDLFDNVKQIKFDGDEKLLRDAVSLDEVRRAIDAAVDGDETEKKLRDKVCIALMASCGFRTIELVRSNRKDFYRRNGHFFLNVQGKGKDSKVEVPVPAIVANMIQSYLNLRSKRGVIDENAPLFVSTSNRNRDERLQTQTISRMAKGILIKIGAENLNKKSAHSFRATCATLAIMSKCSIYDVAKLLRHKNCLTTERYVKLCTYNETADTVAQKIFMKG